VHHLVDCSDDLARTVKHSLNQLALHHMMRDRTIFIGIVSGVVPMLGRCDAG
jgi:hypothetical protein